MVIILGGVAHQHFSSCPQLLLLRSDSRQVWPGNGGSLPLYQPCLWHGGFTLGRALIKILGLSLPLPLIVRKAEKAWGYCLSLPTPVLSSESRGVFWRTTPLSPPQLQSVAQIFIWRQKQAVKHVAPIFFFSPKELTLFAAECGEGEA